MAVKNTTALPIFAIGFLSIGFQVYLLRELLVLFHGIEMVIGLSLAFWILSTGLGALLANRIRIWSETRNKEYLFLFVFGLLPVVILITVNRLNIWLVPRGSVPDFSIIVFIISVAQLPFCFMNGWLFSTLNSRGNVAGLSQAYAMESLGSAVAGALVNFALLWLIDTLLGVWILSVAYLLMITTHIVFQDRKVINALFLGIFWISVLCFIHFTFSNIPDQGRFPGQKLISKKDTPYGRIEITESAGQLNYYSNGTLLFSSGNEIYNEEGVHYAMVQHPWPRKVLLISGGFTGMISEVLKYKPERIDYLEQDPSLIDIASKFTRQLNDSAVHVYNMDPVRFIRQTRLKFDVVLINLPPPASLQVNRFYTIEFIGLLKKHLLQGAVVAWNLPVSAEYQDAAQRKNISILWSTIKGGFEHELIVPGNRIFFIASDSSLTLNIADQISRKNVETLYVNQYYLDQDRMKVKSAELTPEYTTFKKNKSDVNHDIHPLMVWNMTAWQIGFFQLDYRLLIAVFSLILILLVFTLKSVSSGLFTSGFTLTSTEIMLIFGMQVLFGNIVFACGLIIMLFMVGLAMGSLIKVNPAFYSRTGFSRIQLIMAFLSGILSVCLYFMIASPLSDVFKIISMVFLTLSISYLAGLEYRVACSISSGNSAKIVSKNYSADLFGASAGALSVSLILIPLLGILVTGLFLLILNLGSSIYFKLKVSS